MLLTVLVLAGCPVQKNATTASPVYAVYIAIGGSCNVSAYTIDASTGALSEVAGSPFAAGTDPIAIVAVKLP